MGLVLPSTYEQTVGLDRHQYGDIVGRVQQGDMTVGWRGDPSMDVWRKGSSVAVFGFDRAGERYKAAEISMVEDNWQRRLLEKLRDGDWQSSTAYDDLVIKPMERHAKERDHAKSELIGEAAEELAGALYRLHGVKEFF